MTSFLLIDSFYKYLSDVYHLLGTVLSAGETLGNKNELDSCSHYYFNLAEKNKD